MFLPIFAVVVPVSVYALIQIESNVQEKPVELKDIEGYRWCSLIAFDVLLTLWFV